MYRRYLAVGEKIELINNINFAPVKISNFKKRILLSLIIIAAPSAASADIIYFKDGMKTVCLEKAWEENGEVKCEYDGVVLSYKKSEVERIEKRRIRKSAPTRTALPPPKFPPQKNRPFLQRRPCSPMVSGFMIREERIITGPVKPANIKPFKLLWPPWANNMSAHRNGYSPIWEKPTISKKFIGIWRQVWSRSKKSRQNPSQKTTRL
jgi:hypothetical protein